MSEWANECVWVNERTSEWVNEQMNERMSEWTRKWMIERVSEWANEWVNERMKKWMIERVSEWANEDPLHYYQAVTVWVVWYFGAVSSRIIGVGWTKKIELIKNKKINSLGRWLRSNCLMMNAMEGTMCGKYPGTQKIPAHRQRKNKWILWWHEADDKIAEWLENAKFVEKTCLVG